MTHKVALHIVSLAAQMVNPLVETKELRQAKEIVASGRSWPSRQHKPKASGNPRKQRVGRIKPQTPERPEIAVVAKIVCKELNLGPETIKLRVRTKAIKEARQIVHYLVYILYNDITFREIGEATGGLDHSTVMHSVDVIEDRMKVYPEFNKKVSKLKLLIQNIR